eukprot:scaffold1766_cov401-Prasinococcus_capsulatus_cf.AAC.38
MTASAGAALARSPPPPQGLACVRSTWGHLGPTSARPGPRPRRRGLMLRRCRGPPSGTSGGVLQAAGRGMMLRLCPRWWTSAAAAAARCALSGAPVACRREHLRQGPGKWRRSTPRSASGAPSGPGAPGLPKARERRPPGALLGPRGPSKSGRGAGQRGAGLWAGARAAGFGRASRRRAEAEQAAGAHGLRPHPVLLPCVAPGLPARTRWIPTRACLLGFAPRRPLGEQEASEPHHHQQHHHPHPHPHRPCSPRGPPPRGRSGVSPAASRGSMRACEAAAPRQLRKALMAQDPRGTVLVVVAYPDPSASLLI